MKLPKLYAEFPGLATCLQMLSMKYGRHLDHVPSSSFVWTISVNPSDELHIILIDLVDEHNHNVMQILINYCFMTIFNLTHVRCDGVDW